MGTTGCAWRMDLASWAGTTGKEANDPAAQRNSTSNGYTQRTDRNDQLENLHIGSSKTVPQGATSTGHHDVSAQGPE